MSALMDAAPYATRDDAAFLRDMVALSRHHLNGCAPYRAMWPEWHDAATPADLPFVHVGAFKERLLATEAEGLRHLRVLQSSATTSGIASKVQLDERSSALQACSAQAILVDWLGGHRRPLVVFDDPRSLRHRGDVSARLAAALSLRPLASDMHFVLPDPARPETVRWDAFDRACEGSDELLVYGFTWILWLALGRAEVPETTLQRLRRTRIRFVHSGGWKKLEAERVDRQQFDAALLSRAGPGSSVLDYYGLVEQVGVICPQCEAGARHLPRWADVVVRDPWTHAPIEQGGVGQLQFMNLLAWGAPYHSVLTEDLGEVLQGDCRCGRHGRRFVLHGRIPKAETRGCANV
ncbi:MAG: hypothetical protein WAQ05_20025 [Rubrivivax sp.]